MYVSSTSPLLPVYRQTSSLQNELQPYSNLRNHWNLKPQVKTIRSISGLVVEYMVAIDVTRVGFPNDALWYYADSSVPFTVTNIHYQYLKTRDGIGWSATWDGCCFSCGRQSAYGWVAPVVPRSSAQPERPKNTYNLISQLVEHLTAEWRRHQMVPG